MQSFDYRVQSELFTVGRFDFVDSIREEQNAIILFEFAVRSRIIDLIEKAKTRPGPAGFRFKQFHSGRGSPDSNWIRVACVGKLNFLFRGVGDHVKRSGDKRLINPFQDRAEPQIERAQKTSRILHYSSKFLQQSPNDRGYQSCAQTMPHDVADEDTRAIL